ncbi:MAG: aminomethyl-transferring glycine dehydrogenase [Xanthomonadales bacterium]|nr:aminomethyl-transferring glycine dehydrogenase [Xanthomonadales bacterium]
MSNNPFGLQTLTELEDHGAFIRRHIGPDEQEIEDMLKAVGEPDLDSLIRSTLPSSILDTSTLELQGAQTEQAILDSLRRMAGQNRTMHNMIGLGYHETVTPPVIQRNVLENPGWYTAYTPYQAEISQGRLEALLNFQQMVCDLTGMELANASLLDEATAAAEAMAQIKRDNRKNTSMRFIIDEQCLPQTIDVLRTRARFFEFELAVGDPAALLDEGDAFGMLLQYPGADGGIVDLEPLISKGAQNEVRTVVAADLMSLALLKPPGEMGADIVVGSAQRFGVPMGFGGPHAAFYATRERFKRSIPGRIIGVSKDRHGRLALRMALQTREQHIRRDKATSNICTAQALLAVMASMYAVYHGPRGLQRIASRIHRMAALLAHGLKDSGFEVEQTGFFDTFTVNTGAQSSDTILARAAKAGINLRPMGDKRIGLSVGENTTRDHVEAIWQSFSPGHSGSVASLERSKDFQPTCIPLPLQRQSEFMQHEVFSLHHSETEMLRYLKRLENRDLSLAHAMISLGSCTMKLNATAEMIPVTWPEFAHIHPFAPGDQTRGYRQLIRELEAMLQACTGYDAVSLQPNAGSQGEYAGLIAILDYHASRGDRQRKVCLIPSSAHGTNPASASMAGMSIVVVKCDDNGNVDLADLEAKAEQYSDTLAALMITYPSTHGVFEQEIIRICDIVHEHGGQVYLDGANLNALVGCAAPGKFGADVSHLNLHKTFCIPHGGGGPGVGPVCVGSHLAPFMPGHQVVNIEAAHGANGPVAAAPWGSAGILPISWAYIAMMGHQGMKKATQVAILSANYIAQRLGDAYPVLYKGKNGRVAHECIIDLRPFKDAGVSEEDVAKRLIDYGFHAPTMSFPVPGTLMIEPTESEPKTEIDRFCDAMLLIRDEIRKVESGEWPADDNPLANSPHNSMDLVGDWDHPYSREVAVYPAENLKHGKFWPQVTRVDNVYGDRHLFCSCPPLEAWLEEDAELEA